MQISQGSLVIVGANTQTAQVFWNGVVVPNIVGIRVDWENDEQRVKLKASIDDVIYNELRTAGINVKLEAYHG